MSDDKLKSLDKFTVATTEDGSRILSMHRPTSATGKITQCCPNEMCEPRIFQIGQIPGNKPIPDEFKMLIRREPGTKGTTCPYCGIDGDDQDFIFEDDKEHAHKEIMHAVTQDISNMLSGIAKNFNSRSSRNSFVSITMEHKPSANPAPKAYREDLLRSISCDICAREYGVYALALFCPDCGSSNLSTHFNREVEIINKQIEASKLIDNADNREASYRLLANAHEDVLTALEATLKVIYHYIVKKSFPDKIQELDKIGNAFQNLDKTEIKFKEINIDILSTLSTDEREFLSKAIQKRHVIGHNLGLADKKYNQAADDAQVGKNVPILTHEIEQFSILCTKIITLMEKELCRGS